MNPEWLDVEPFYAADERREHSVEHPLPGTWCTEDWTPYQVFWLGQTGEIVAISRQPVCSATVFGDGQEAGRRVELIGWTGSLRQAEKMLSGWPTHAGKMKSYYWLRRRAESTDGIVPGRDVTDEHRDRAAAETGSLF